jgi:hypothetical protein
MTISHTLEWTTFRDQIRGMVRGRGKLVLYGWMEMEQYS